MKYVKITIALISVYLVSVLTLSTHFVDQMLVFTVGSITLFLTMSLYYWMIRGSLRWIGRQFNYDHTQNRK